MHLVCQCPTIQRSRFELPCKLAKKCSKRRKTFNDFSQIASLGWIPRWPRHSKYLPRQRGQTEKVWNVSELSRYACGMSQKDARNKSQEAQTWPAPVHTTHVDHERLLAFPVAGPCWEDMQLLPKGHLERLKNNGKTHIMDYTRTGLFATSLPPLFQTKPNKKAVLSVTPLGVEPCKYLNHLLAIPPVSTAACCRASL